MRWWKRNPPDQIFDKQRLIDYLYGVEKSQGYFYMFDMSSCTECMVAQYLRSIGFNVTMDGFARVIFEDKPRRVPLWLRLMQTHAYNYRDDHNCSAGFLYLYMAYHFNLRRSLF